MSKLLESAQAAVEAFDKHGYSPLTIGAIWALRDALAEERLAESEEETITLFAWEDDYEYSVWGELRQVGNNLYEKVGR